MDRILSDLSTMNRPSWVAPHGLRRAQRSYSTFKVRIGGCEEVPLMQGKVKPNEDGRCCERASEGRHTETILTEN